MDELWGALSVIGMVVLRVGVPLGITIGAMQLFRRLDVRWQTQDWQHWSERLAESGGLAGQNWLSRLSNPCWDEKCCEDTAVAKCAAHAHQSIPCWMARRSADGALPGKCTQCERYTMGSQVATD